MSDQEKRPARPWDLFNKKIGRVTDIIAKERAKERAKKANEEVDEELDEGMIKSIGNVFKKKVAPKATSTKKTTKH